MRNEPFIRDLVLAVALGEELENLSLSRRRATVDYRNAANAFDDGYGAFAIPPDVGGSPTEGLGRVGDPTCFDSSAGGLGVHCVNFIDGDVSVTQPEALVYEIGENGRLGLVGVEYIVPEDLVDPDNLPSRFGQQFHHHSYLPGGR